MRPLLEDYRLSEVHSGGEYLGFGSMLLTFLQNLVDMDSRRRLEVFEEMLLLACQIVLSDFGKHPEIF
jgi:hypothetical protein